MLILQGSSYFCQLSLHGHFNFQLPHGLKFTDPNFRGFFVCIWQRGGGGVGSAGGETSFLVVQQVINLC